MSALDEQQQAPDDGGTLLWVDGPAPGEGLPVRGRFSLRGESLHQVADEVAQESGQRDSPLPAVGRVVVVLKNICKPPATEKSVNAMGRGRKSAVRPQAMSEAGTIGEAKSSSGIVRSSRANCDTFWEEILVKATFG